MIENDEILNKKLQIQFPDVYQDRENNLIDEINAINQDKHSILYEFVSMIAKPD